jgi:hypothetical protein
VIRLVKERGKQLSIKSREYRRAGNDGIGH